MITEFLLCALQFCEIYSTLTTARNEETEWQNDSRGARHLSYRINHSFVTRSKCDASIIVTFPHSSLSQPQGFTAHWPVLTVW